MLKIENVKQIDCHELDSFVFKTYGKPYCFQQQDGCQPRGIVTVTVGDSWSEEEYMHNEIPLELNGSEQGVKFDVWLNTDPNVHKKKMNWDDWEVKLFWDRNFYPHIHSLFNDMHSKGLIDSGEYQILIDW